MTLTMTLGKLVSLKVPLVMLARIPLSARLGYSIAQTLKAFNEHLTPFDEEMKKLGRKYDATFAPDDSGFEVPKENEAAFRVETEELKAVEVTIDVRKIELPPECELPAAILVDLEEFVSVKGMDESKTSGPVDAATGKPMAVVK